MGRFMLWLLLCVGFVASGESFVSQLNQGNEQLREGDAAGALVVYRELARVRPDSDTLRYNTGLAYYEKGLASANVAEKAATFREAARAFALVQASGDETVRVQAAYNHANCTAQLALQHDASGDYGGAVRVLRDAVAVYERFLLDSPGHEGARQNLGHVRYRLKRLLQNPPEEEQQSADQEPPPSPLRAARIEEAGSDVEAATTETSDVENMAIVRLVLGGAP